MLAGDASSPDGVTVQQLDSLPPGDAGYLSPFINVVAGQSYCLRAKVKWVSGDAPFLGVARYAGDASIRTSWLIAPAYVDDLGPTTGVSSAVAGWQDLARTFVMPADTSKVRLTDQLRADASKGGDPLAYFDGISLDSGACALTTASMPYQQDWDGNDGVWLDGRNLPPVLADDPTSPNGPTVARLDHVGDYTSQPIRAAPPTTTIVCGPSSSG